MVSLAVADRVIYPEMYADRHREWSISEMIKRNSRLLCCFSDRLSNIDGNCLGKHEETFRMVNRYLDCYSLKDLLHIPGQVHELGIDEKKPGGLQESDRNSKESARKKQGSYYTPPYIVRYMVRNSLDYLFHGKMPTDQQPDIRVVDPACGGASFLIEVFNGLVDKGFPVFQAVDSVFGMDIDREAVNLCIYILTVAVIARNRSINDPEETRRQLGKQIRTGNALDNKAFLESNEFDLVIGNPPYISNKLISQGDKDNYRENYLSAGGQYDLSVLFMERGLGLLRREGLLNFITSNKFLGADYGRIIRKELLENHRLLSIVDVSTLQCFAGTAAYPVIITVKKCGGCDSVAFSGAKMNGPVKITGVTRWAETETKRPAEVEQSFFRENSDFLITTRLDDRVLPLLKKISRAGGRIPRSSILCGLAQPGFSRWVRGKGTGDEMVITDPHERPFIRAGHIRPYSIAEPEVIDTRYLQKKNTGVFQGPKLVIPGISKSLTAALDNSGSILGRVYFIRENDTSYDLRYLAVLLNSHVMNFYYKVMYWPVHLAGGYLRFNSGYIANLPVYPVQGELWLNDGETVHEIIALGDKLSNGEQGGRERESILARAEAAVYSLYGFDREEASMIMNFLEIDGTVQEKIRDAQNEYRKK